MVEDRLVGISTSQKRKRGKGLRRGHRASIVRDADITCATLAGAGGPLLLELGVRFDTVIIDEAAQTVETSCLNALLHGSDRCVLVGDQKQLRPTIINKLALEINFDRSLFVRLMENGFEPNLLSIQYRSHPQISQFPSNHFYAGKVKDGPNLLELKRAPWHRDPLLPPFCFYDVESSERHEGRSLVNDGEVKVVLSILRRIFRQHGHRGKVDSTIGVVTPYKKQKEYLLGVIEDQFGKSSEFVTVNTVDAFQGQEKDLMIMSCVRAGSGFGFGIGFLNDQSRRMNVALTRAKKSMIVVGNAEQLATDKTWNELILHSKRANVFKTV
ncbi:hypothetical protein T439DRAFT_291165 [Meredithblackwellia eburnea MCA 4105]